ncbi:unnamed protein product [Pleuronectes platessa]|uniref:Uncharacterized protein n=1 Tax=Pleuronectes platessa TaxID=8262 RepID=A0A9N7UWM4_PLEPL|nr:unnamed protein product [Pleuronectes platessa]
MSHGCNTVNIGAWLEVSRSHSVLVLFSSSSERLGIMQLSSFLGALSAGGSLSSQFTTLTACVTDSEPQICRESCLDNCQLSLSLIAIKDEGNVNESLPDIPDSPRWFY